MTIFLTEGCTVTSAIEVTWPWVFYWGKFTQCSKMWQSWGRRFDFVVIRNWSNLGTLKSSKYLKWSFMLMTFWGRHLHKIAVHMMRVFKIYDEAFVFKWEFNEFSWSESLFKIHQNWNVKTVTSIFFFCYSRKCALVKAYGKEKVFIQTSSEGSLQVCNSSHVFWFSSPS